MSRDLSHKKVELELPEIRDAALRMFVGECLGNGWRRHVYAVRGDDKRVVKIERGTNFDNVAEWLIWQAVKDTEAARWFAPCLEISPCGRVLIQRRTETFSEEGFKDTVTKVPEFFDDIYWANWGLLYGGPVCHDYARHRFITQALSSFSMIEVPDKP